MQEYLKLPDRNFIKLSGPHNKKFIQRIITNDINKIEQNKIIYTCMLNRDGKFLFDFFIFQIKEDLIIECQKEWSKEIIERLTFVKLNMNVTIIIENYISGIIFGKIVNNLHDNFIYAIDPRNPVMGTRFIGKINNDKNYPYINEEQYEKLRINNFILDGYKDLIQNKSLPLEYGIDRLNGISFNKGCYTGQESISLIKYKGAIRKKLFHVKGNTLPPRGEKLYYKEKKIGIMCSSFGNIGMALLNQDTKENTIINENIAVTNAIKQEPEKHMKFC